MLEPLSRIFQVKYRLQPLVHIHYVFAYSSKIIVNSKIPHDQQETALPGCWLSLASMSSCHFQPLNDSEILQWRVFKALYGLRFVFFMFSARKAVTKMHAQGEITIC